MSRHAPGLTSHACTSCGSAALAASQAQATPNEAGDRTAMNAMRRRVVIAASLLPLNAPLLVSCGRREPVEDYSDKLTPGILLEEEKALLPAGELLRDLHPKGLALTKLSEGWVPRLYNDAAGYCTIGYGHLAYRSRCDGKTPKEFLGGISEEVGSQLLLVDMQRAQSALQLAVRNHPALLSDTQYAALCDFIFNVGGGNFRSSTLLRLILARQFDGVPAQLRRWILAGGKVFEGLKKRREREIELFFDGQAIPKAIPRADEDLSPLDVLPPSLAQR